MGTSPKRHIVLISCVSKKLDRREQAKNLYISTLFKKSRSWAEQNGDLWYILSAKHGLVHPNDEIWPYDKTLLKMRKAERLEWAKTVISQLNNVVRPTDRVTILAGRKYYENLIEPLDQRSIKVDLPLSQMPIGSRLRWLSQQIA